MRVLEQLGVVQDLMRVCVVEDRAPQPPAIFRGAAAQSSPSTDVRTTSLTYPNHCSGHIHLTVLASVTGGTAVADRPGANADMH